MESVLQFLILLLLISDLAMLWSGRIPTLIRLSALQGFIIGGVLMLPEKGAFNAEHIMLALLIIGIKGIGFPYFLRKVSKKIGLTMLAVVRLGRMAPLLAGLVCLALSLLLESRTPSLFTSFPPMLLSVSLTTVFSGLIIIICAVKAFTQILGYLTLENGIFILGIPLMTQGSVWFEISILLDVFVAIFVMAIAITHVNSAFHSIELQNFRSLRD